MSHDKVMKEGYTEQINRLREHFEPSTQEEIDEVLSMVPDPHKPAATIIITRIEKFFEETIQHLDNLQTDLDKIMEGVYNG